jgi:stage V sporulation protein D (sporulation-specific penicillin-binding protein)
MIEGITGFCALINGGYYYEPHVVKRIVSSSGATIKNVEPRVLRQVISQSTSDKIVEFCNTVVSGPNGTGKTARPAGYMIGGKTGTAQTLPRGNRQYVVSFMGYAPADDPEIAIYVVVDRPNARYQDDAKFATRIVRAVLTEALPYLNYPMTEPLSEKEQAELEELREKMITSAVATTEEGEETTEEGTEETTEETQTEEETTEEETQQSSIWETFDVDQSTGYYIDPNTGDYIDPSSGHAFGGDDLPDFSGENTDSSIFENVENGGN